MSKELIVYWSPYQGYENTQVNFNLLYEDPEPLRNILKPNPNNKQRSFFRCPSFNDIVNNIHVIKNPAYSKLKTDGENVYPMSETYVNAKISGGPSIENHQVIDYAIQNIFFCEESLEMSLTGPYFSNSPYLSYGSVVPGKLDISKWFRPVNIEIQLHKGNKEIEMLEGEHLAYVNFLTDRRVKIKRFEIDNDLYRISLGCSTAVNWEKRVPLSKRYERFMKTKTNKMVIQHIKKNLVD
jgi:hypothetical protein